jgi:hypothetical protein
MKHSIERGFASIVMIWEVLRRGRHQFGRKEPMRSKQTTKTHE